MSIGAAAVLDAVSLEVRAGEVLALVGASGSGKSLLALAILQLLPPGTRLAGAVRLAGVELTGRSDAELCRVRGRDIGMIFQEPSTALDPLMPVGRQVAETIRLHERVNARTARDRAWEALGRVGLASVPGIAARRAHELSGGQRQRVAIALAVALRPRLLIADEPTTALDVITQAEVLDLLEGLVRDSGMGMLLVTHDMAVVARTAGRVAVMQAGRIIEQAPRVRLKELVQPYSRALLAAAQLPAHSARSASLRAAPSAPPAGDAAAGDPAAGDPPAGDAAAGDPAAGALLEVRAVVREYGRPRVSLWRPAPPLRAVDGVSLRVLPGESVGLVGASGSGKSSLLRVILALDRPGAGDVCLCGESFSGARGATLRRLRRSVQAVFQDPYGSFDPEWTVERLVAEPFHLLDPFPAGAERRRRVALALEQVGLSAPHAARHPHEFSGGERQRIAIARALVIEPELIIFDEAVSALDVLIRAQILDLLAELQARRGFAYLFITHDLSVVRSITERLYVMQAGRIVEDGGTEELFSRPRHAYTAALLAAMPRLDAD